MIPTTARRRFTVDDYYRMADAGVLSEDDRVELIEGEILDLTPISSRHAACVDRLNAILTPLAADRWAVRVQNPVRLDAHSEPQPDLALLHPSPDAYASAHPGPDEVFVIVEVAESSLTYDRGTKASLYARAGIPEFWIVDVNGESVEVLRQPGADDYGASTTYRRGESLAPEAFPDLSIAVDSIFG